MSSTWDFLTDHKNLFVPIAIFLIAFFPRAYYMNDGLFHTDSVIMAIAVENTFETLKLHYMHPPGYPGQVMLATLLYAVDRILTGADSAEFAATFTSVLFGSLGVVMMYYFTKEFLRSKRIAIFSALVLTVFPVYLSLSTYAKDHASEVFFLLLSAYLAARAANAGSDKLKILGSMALGYSVTIRIVNFLFIPFFILIYYNKKFPLGLEKKADVIRLKLSQAPGDFLKDAIMLLVPAALVFIILYMPMFTTQGLEPLTSVAGYARWLGVYDSRVTPLSVAWATVSITPLGWLLAIIGFVTCFKGQRYKSIVILSWSLAFFLYGGNLSITSPRYVIPALLPVVIFIAVAVDTIWKRWGKTPSTVVLLVLMIWMFFTIQPIISYRSDFSGPKSFALEVKNISPPDALILTMDQSYHIEYYAKRNARGYSVANGMAGIDDMLTDVDAHLDAGTPVYMMSSLFSYQGRDALIQRMSEKYDIITIGAFPNEDWHHKSIVSGLNNETLFKLEKKSA